VSVQVVGTQTRFTL